MDILYGNNICLNILTKAAAFPGLLHDTRVIPALSPEAADNGPIAIVRDGDIIDIDINNKKINMELSDNEILKRLKELSIELPGIKSSYLFCIEGW